jgi:hypothetical protein
LGSPPSRNTDCPLALAASQIDHTMLEPETRSGSGSSASRLAQIKGIPSATTKSASSIRPFWMGSLR